MKRRWTFLGRLQVSRFRGFFMVCGAVALGLAVWLGGGAALQVGKAWLAPVLIKRAWASAVEAGGMPPPPWPWADTRPVLRLSVPRLHVDRYILDGANGRALAFGPVLSNPGGVHVIYGHRDTHFAFLESIRLGDRLLVQTVNGPPVPYRVHEIAVRDEDDIAIVSNGGDAPLVLVTCYPFHALDPTGRLRYVLLAAREHGGPAGLALAR
ncbi:sortase domain-bontaining protein [Hwanghaeella grinnelliae]|nr:sortase [Hwanghaeella grinnelliae]